MDIRQEAVSRYEQLKEYCRANWDASSVEKLEEAFSFALNAIGDKKFITGEYILNHSLDVASIIAVEIGLEPDSVISGILHNIMYAGIERPVTKEEIEKQFGVSVYSILEGMAKINALGTDTVDIHAENYRKLLLALAGDVRVILVKTADRLQVMRNLDFYDTDTRKRLANETSHLYAPLAHRLGLYAINSELLDLCLKYQKPLDYQYINERLTENELERSRFVAEFVKPVEKILSERGYNFSMKART
ncbi:MAG: HD domain-containing protein, partial [Prolixibacteraceae bacterium]|nr:HD domain-containing protein [Prolixibacteraceae bacterium]